MDDIRRAKVPAPLKGNDGIRIMLLPKRNAVTLIELLVVIAIIGILISLATYGVFVVRARDTAATNNIELSEFRSALEQFKAKYGIYPPSQVKLDPSVANVTAADPMLARIWPNLKFPEAGQSLKTNFNVTSAVTLTGDQCLVFFLGGVHSAGSGAYGFSESKADPFQSGGNREGPYFKFKPKRLVNRGTSGGVCSYVDPFEGAPNSNSMCYAYFCPLPVGGYAGAVNHCNTLKDVKGNFPQPYKEDSPSGSYWNLQSYQIMTPGKDREWGTGLKWSPATPSDPSKGFPHDSANNPAQTSNDNYANFANGLLSGN